MERRGEKESVIELPRKTKFVSRENKCGPSYSRVLDIFTRRSAAAKECGNDVSSAHVTAGVRTDR